MKNITAKYKVRICIKCHTRTTRTRDNNVCNKCGGQLIEPPHIPKTKNCKVCGKEFEVPKVGFIAVKRTKCDPCGMGGIKTLSSKRLIEVRSKKYGQKKTH